MDNNTILKFTRGDSDAFHDIFKSLYPRIFNFVLGFLKNHDDAEDATQLVFIKLWTNHEKFVAVNNFDSYIFTLTKYTVLNYIAAKKVVPLDIDVIPDIKGDASPYDKLVEHDMKLLIDMVVEDMPKQRQTIYRMSREQHMKNEEIAEKLGLQKKTVENHINLALSDIRKAIMIITILLANWV
ncbi:RNA polymerase sigma-70 factor [Xylanibacter oryzae]|uniref:RNA polymerase sigma-70 factor n=1 Tax=Xylanibacter oryzae TaxID=185293 RepID=UPI0004BC41B5|nr:RNA polymerase sigma-70 factor [Xylanibacter oryzae]